MGCDPCLVAWLVMGFLVMCAVVIPLWQLFNINKWIKETIKRMMDWMRKMMESIKLPSFETSKENTVPEPQIS
jgi:hypothetical protein